MSRATYEPSAEIEARGAGLGFTRENLQALIERRDFVTEYIIATHTRGGTYVLASAGKWNDNGKPRDLLAILPAAVMPDQGGHGPVVALSIFVSPDALALVADTLAEARS